MTVVSDVNKLADNNYIHARLEPQRRFLRFLLKYVGFSILAKVGTVEGIDNVPAEGPAILMYNHICLIDTMLIMHVLPRNIVPMAKVEAYDYPIVGLIPKMWGVISVRRGEIDRKAISASLERVKSWRNDLYCSGGYPQPSAHHRQGRHRLPG